LSGMRSAGDSPESVLPNEWNRHADFEVLRTPVEEDAAAAPALQISP